ncbi:hypothetical protein LTR37_006127 [Vermiconidia calcicola]|uniref:Uncharacterized protein n=1 Tax=Vermiconidia calcicola TaxID=1690605 RepID=A0ACC3NKF5_9PEZI|nr:hypothetical protein LTR37_006127 [Vermiconidia calcicola]
MAMHVHFKHERLHVGYRAKDWRDVWFDPKKPDDSEGAEASEDEGAGNRRKKKEEPVYYYMSSTGKDIWRAPKASEVYWLPFFDISLCESKDRKDKQALQWQFLMDAHNYLNEKDPVMVDAFERQFDQPGFSRWQAFFRQAQKWKKNDLRNRRRRRSNRTQTALQAGANGAEVAEQVNSDSSDDSEADSTYESVIGGVSGRARAASASMPPPPPRRPGGKRKAPGNGADTRRPPSKKVKSEQDSQRRQHYNRNHPSPSVLNGVMGSSRGSPRNRVYEGADSNADDEDHESETFDTRPPPEMPDFDLEPDDNRARDQFQRSRRGGSSRDITPFEQWAGADQIQEEIGFEGGPDAENASNADNDAESNVVRAWQATVESYNGSDLDEEEAFQQAVRASLPPPDRSQRGSVVPSVEPRDPSNDVNNIGHDSAA